MVSVQPDRSQVTRGALGGGGRSVSDVASQAQLTAAVRWRRASALALASGVAGIACIAISILILVLDVSPAQLWQPLDAYSSRIEAVLMLPTLVLPSLALALGGLHPDRREASAGGRQRSHRVLGRRSRPVRRRGHRPRGDAFFQLGQLGRSLSGDVVPAQQAHQPAAPSRYTSVEGQPAQVIRGALGSHWPMRGERGSRRP